MTVAGGVAAVCWNPRCEKLATAQFRMSDSETDVVHAVCSQCMQDYYSADAFCQGCGWGYGPTEEPVDEDNYYLGCEKCPRWTHRLCDPQAAVAVHDEPFLDEYVCRSCRSAGRGEVTWKFLAQWGRGVASDGVSVLSEPLPVVAAREKTSSGSVFPCFLVGFDFRASKTKTPVVLLCLTGTKWQQWNQRVENVFPESVASEEALVAKTTKTEWEAFRQAVADNQLPEAATKRLKEIRRRLTEPEIVQKNSGKNRVSHAEAIAQGLVDPLSDLAFEEDEALAQPGDFRFPFPTLATVWAKVMGLAWAPAVVSWVSRETREALVFFLEGVTGLAADRENREPGGSAAGGRKYAFVGENALKFFDASLDHHAAYVKQTRGNRKLVDAVSLAEAIVKKTASIPTFIEQDARNRERIQQHVDAELQRVPRVRRELKLQHLKLFLETNMLEMHWRTIARTRQYVRVETSELYGGYHLVAAQDWPTDREICEGLQEEVYLVYCGNVLTKEEADAMESDTSRPDRNRYVAEIPGTQIIASGASEGLNVNTTGSNLFVDGLKYADPESPLWAPGPTVNHEREQYCKLEPRHSVTDNLRGFWLQRKKGAVIRQGEPLFWSYDCGAGKFDADFGLTSDAPPPHGWRVR